MTTSDGFPPPHIGLVDAWAKVRIAMDAFTLMSESVQSLCTHENAVQWDPKYSDFKRPDCQSYPMRVCVHCGLLNVHKASSIPTALILTVPSSDQRSSPSTRRATGPIISACHAPHITTGSTVVPPQLTPQETDMTLDDIKAAVDAGKRVHWANEGYVVHKDSLGQYLITFEPNGSTVGLTDRASTKTNGESCLFFISRPDLGVTAHCEDCQSEDVQQECWARWNSELQFWEVDELEDKAFCNGCQSATRLITRPIRDYGAGGKTAPQNTETPTRPVADDSAGKGESRLSVL